MQNKLNFTELEVQILSEIKSYKDSQDELRNYIFSGTSTDENLEYYLINDEWLYQWKKYTCYESIKFNLSLNITKILREKRTQNRADQINISNINNKILLNNNMDNINNNQTIRESLNIIPKFHLVTKECFRNLVRNRNLDKEIKFKFKLKNGILFTKYLDKIIVLYENNQKLNLILLIFVGNTNRINGVYDFIELFDKFEEFLINLNPDINKDHEREEFEGGKIVFLNKSYWDIQLEDEKIKKVFSSLINLEYNFYPNLNSSGINKMVLYLINNNWIDSFKKRLNYLEIINKYGISGIGQTTSINKLLESYKNNISSNSLNKIEKINNEDYLYNYLIENNTKNYIKLYDDYTLITEDLWNNLIELFEWNIEVKLDIYIIKKNIIVMYNENDFEIFELLNDRKKINNFFFHIYDSTKTKQVVDDIKNLGVMEYYKKYNINLSENNQSSFKLLDNFNNNICFGFAININNAKIDIINFSLIIESQLNENNYHMGYNSKIIEPINQNNNNNLINSFNNNNFNNNININNSNNQNNNNRIEDFNQQFMNMNLNEINNNNNIGGQNETMLILKNINQINGRSTDKVKYVNGNSEVYVMNEFNHILLNQCPNYPQNIINQNNNNGNQTQLNFNNNNNFSNNNMFINPNNMNNQINNKGSNDNINFPQNNNNINNFNNNQNNINNNFNMKQNENFIMNPQKTFNVNPNNNINFMNIHSQNIISNQNQIVIYLLKSIVLCLSKCKDIFNNIIMINCQEQYMPIIYSLKNIFINNDYNIGLEKLKENLERTAQHILNCEEPKNIFQFILERINIEIGGSNSYQNSFILQNIIVNNRNIIYDEFIKQIFQPINNTFISKNFFGIMEIITNCQRCRKKNCNFEIFKFIEFSIEEVNKFLVGKLNKYFQGEENKMKRIEEIYDNNLNSNIITIDNCFEYYTEKIIQKNNVFCRNCKYTSSSTNGIYQLEKMPNILCLFFKNKKDYKVSIKIEEKLHESKYLLLKKYELICAIIDTGNNIKYNAMIKNKENTSWELYLENNNKEATNIYDAKTKGKPVLLIYQAINNY